MGLGPLGVRQDDTGLPPMGPGPLGAHDDDEQDSEMRRDSEDESDPFGLGFAD